MARRRSTDRQIAQAQRAIEQNDVESARALLEAAARQDPTDTRPWLLLAGIATSARERRMLLAQADRLKAAPPPLAAPVRSSTPVATSPATVAYPAPLGSRHTGNGLARTGLIVLFLLIAAIGAYVVVQSPVGEALVQDVAGPSSASGETAEIVAELSAVLPEPTTTAGQVARPSDTFASIDLPEATAESAGELALLPPKEVASNGQPLATWTVTAEPTPTLAPTVTPTATPEPSPTPVPPPPGSPRPYGVGETEKWIDVNLTTQTLIAYEGDTSVLTTLISSGAWQYQTVTGEFRTYLKYETQLMNGYLLGYDYYTPDVPSVMYFYEDFAIHGAYWHNNFGTPVSHGCVNAPVAEASWLFNWAPVGTFVTVHY